MTNVLEWFAGLFTRPAKPPMPAESTVTSFNPAAMSERGREWLEAWEGYRERPYLDAAGVLTWGIGHAQKAGELPPVFLTIAEARRLFSADLRPCEEAVLGAVERVIVQCEFDALVAFAFNVGVRAFLTSTLVKRLNEGSRDAAREEWMRWVHGGGAVIPGLVRRRESELSVFRLGIYRGP